MTDTTQPQILIVDDDPEILDLLSHYLGQEGFRVFTSSSGSGIDHILSENRINLVLLDLMLPGEGGLSICRRVRANSAIPIIILTAKGDETDRIVGLEMGADDYVPKPFNPRELVARIKAVLWRSEHQFVENKDSQRLDVIEFGNWKINLATRSLVNVHDDQIELSSSEFNLLAAFVRNPQRTLSRDQLLDLTQGRPREPFDRSVDVQISRLRRKIETDPAHPVLIKTVRGLGYTFTPYVNKS